MHDPNHRGRQGVWLRVLRPHCVRQPAGEHTGPRWPRRTEVLDLGTSADLLDAVDHDQKRAGIQARTCQMQLSIDDQRSGLWQAVERVLSVEQFGVGRLEVALWRAVEGLGGHGTGRTCETLWTVNSRQRRP
jgi:hypothetical protein